MLLFSYLAIEKFILSFEGAGMGWPGYPSMTSLYTRFAIFVIHTKPVLNVSHPSLPFLSAAVWFTWHSSSVLMFCYPSSQIRHHNHCVYTALYLLLYMAPSLSCTSDLLSGTTATFHYGKSSRHFQISFTNKHNFCCSEDIFNFKRHLH